ncbi:MAG: secretin N-terminal domain-containing protein, partial [Elusimicrobiota bacterium]
MNTNRTGPGLIRRGSALILALFMILETPLTAQAQRRQGEPEANPQFQQQLQAPAGGDIGGPASAAEVEPISVTRAPSVQIGTSGYAKPAPSSTPPLETRVTVRVKGAPLATFLDTISAQAKVNFIITEGLENRKVTAFLQNVTVREALQVLLEIKGLTYQQIGKSNTYVVAPRSRTVQNLITRIYTLSYIPLIALGDINADQAAITPQTSSTGGQGGASGGMGQSSGGGGSGGKGENKENAVSIINVLGSVLSKYGHVALEPRTNALIVTDIPEVFPQVEQIISELDRKAPQVMIEAQIVEIDSSRARNLGFEWGGANGELGSFQGGARDTLFPMNLPKNLSQTKFFDPITNVVSGMNAGSGSSGSSGSTMFGSSVLTSMLDLTSLKVTLRALVSRSEARFLGKPKILTLNNKPAII